MEIVLQLFFISNYPFFRSLRDLWLNRTTVQCLIDKSALSRVFQRVTSDRVNREVSPSRSLLRNRSRILGSERKKQDRSRIERRRGAMRLLHVVLRFRRLISRSSAFFEDTPASISRGSSPRRMLRSPSGCRNRAHNFTRAMHPTKQYLRNFAFGCDPSFPLSSSRYS